MQFSKTASQLKINYNSAFMENYPIENMCNYFIL